NGKAMECHHQFFLSTAKVLWHAQGLQLSIERFRPRPVFERVIARRYLVGIQPVLAWAIVLTETRHANEQTASRISSSRHERGVAHTGRLSSGNQAKDSCERSRRNPEDGEPVSPAEV